VDDFGFAELLDHISNTDICHLNSVNPYIHRFLSLEAAPARFEMDGFVEG